VRAYQNVAVRRYCSYDIDHVRLSVGESSIWSTSYLHV